MAVALEQENRELKRANEILRTASAFSLRRSSTADPGDGGLHRPGEGDVRRRADLPRAADRAVHLLRGQGPGCGSDQALCPGPARGGALHADPAGVDAASRGLWCPEGVAAAAARGDRRRPLYGRAPDAATRDPGRAARGRRRPYDGAGRGRRAPAGPGGARLYGSAPEPSCGCRTSRTWPRGAASCTPRS